MALSTFTSLVFFLFTIALVCASDAPRCYQEVKRCCYRYGPCGFSTKRVRHTKPCGFKKCYRKCGRECEKVTRQEKRRRCNKVVTRVPCPRDTPHLYHGGGGGRKCRPRYEEKWRCAMVNHPVTELVCKRVCRNVCSWVNADCVYFDVFRFRRFCAKAHCGRVKIIGRNANPGAYNGKVGKLLKTENGPRIIKH